MSYIIRDDIRKEVKLMEENQNKKRKYMLIIGPLVLLIALVIGGIVFVHPNNQMIVAGGFKNPDFKIAGESTYGILNKILERFSGEENKLKI